jgi:hypothetical protein
MQFNEEVNQADAKYQKEQTPQNELAMEKAKLKYWQAKLSENPSDKELQDRVSYHKYEVDRLEMDVKMGV